MDSRDGAPENDYSRSKTPRGVRESNLPWGASKSIDPPTEEDPRIVAEEDISFISVER